MSKRRTRSNRVILYSRVSTEEQKESRAGLDAQRDRLEAEAAHRGWSEVTWIADEGESAKNLDRPGITRALEMLRAGEASVLCVAKLDRLSRSIVDFAELLKRAEREGWAIVALDIDVDMTRATGRMVAKIVAVIAEWEREMIGERTADGLKAKKHAGVRLGRPRQTPKNLVDEVARRHADGETLTAIAEDFNRRKIPTVRGGTWWPSTVRALVASHQLDQEARSAA